MLEERAKAQATAIQSMSQHASRWTGSYQEGDINFDPLPATSSSEVKLDEIAPKIGFTQDESAAMVSSQAKHFEINMDENLRN